MRAFEQAVAAGVSAGEIHGEMHIGLGQEAIAAGIEPLLRDTDAVISTHRPHLHALAHGVPPIPLLAEIFERVGMNAGKGGHMHLFDPTRPFMCTGIVGASAPIALGYAFAFRHRGEDNIALAIAGDGAMNIGAVLESLNLAAAWRLPVVFLVEDNGYGISVAKGHASAGELAHRGKPLGVPGFACDGTDPEAVHAAAEPAFKRAREGKGPSIVVGSCYRYSGHYEGDFDLYRSKAEKDAAMAPNRDPIARAETQLLQRGFDHGTLCEMAAEEEGAVAEWVRAACDYPWPDAHTATTGVFA
jgi:pyruvate dehydrogenase E1 component alpha subunit